MLTSEMEHCTSLRVMLREEDILGSLISKLVKLYQFVFETSCTILRQTIECGVLQTGCAKATGGRNRKLMMG